MVKRATPREQWQPILERLAAARARTREMGGADKLQRYVRARAKLDARQRLERLFDPGTFAELGQLVGAASGVPCDAFVAGMGRIDGRPGLAGAEDFTVLGGSIGSGGMAKRYRLAELAMQERAPLVMMLEGAGHRLTDTAMGRVPNDLLAMADLSGHVPMVCLVLGAAAGHSALAAPLSDFTVMTEAAAMFTGGPPLVKAAIGEEVSKEELGGPLVCAEIAGTAHNVVADDAAAIDLARRYLSYFPSHRAAPPPRRDAGDTGRRTLDDILDVVPPHDRVPYPMRAVIELLVDAGSFLEIQPGYGRAIITGLAFLGGRSVALVANDPLHAAGALDAPAAIKAAEFLETIGNFGQPVIFLADNPGVMAGSRAERDGILKWGGRMFRAERRLRNAKLHVLLRKAFGFGAVTMAGTPFDRQTVTYAFPTVTLGSMPAASGGRAAKLDADAQAQVEEEQRAGAYRLANGLGIDEVIDPRELRNALLDGLMLAEARSSSLCRSVPSS